MKKNPRNVAEALTWAEAQINNTQDDWTRKCDGFTARTYGWAFSGERNASSHWLDIPQALHKTLGERQPGDLLYWGRLPSDGHIAIVADNVDLIYSNDIKRRGRIDLVPYTSISFLWGMKYTGCSGPVYPRAGGQTTVPPLIPNATPTVSWAALMNAKARRTYSLDVLTMQRALADVAGLDYSSGPGYFGPRTTAALARYSADLGEPTVNARTVRALGVAKRLRYVTTA